jgi:hypothetical protein
MKMTPDLTGQWANAFRRPSMPSASLTHREAAGLTQGAHVVGRGKLAAPAGAVATDTASATAAIDRVSVVRRKLGRYRDFMGLALRCGLNSP